MLIMLVPPNVRRTLGTLGKLATVEWSLCVLKCSDGVPNSGEKCYTTHTCISGL